MMRNLQKEKSEACLRIINDAKLLKQKISENLAPTRMYIRVKRMLKNE